MLTMVDLSCDFIFRHKKDFLAAISNLKNLVQISPKHILALHMLARVYLEQHINAKQSSGGVLYSHFMLSSSISLNFIWKLLADHSDFISESMNAFEAAITASKEVLP